MSRWKNTRGRRTGPRSSPPKRSSFEIRREQVRDPVLDLVRMAAGLAVEDALDDLVRLHRDPELEVPLAYGAAQDLHEVPLHRGRTIARTPLKVPRSGSGFESCAKSLLTRALLLKRWPGPRMGPESTLNTGALLGEGLPRETESWRTKSTGCGRTGPPS